MGNCVARQATIVENGECKQPIREAEAMEPSKEEGGDNGSKENHGNNSKSGTGVRIRVVVTQRELVQFLKNNESKYSSVEQLLSEMKLKRRRRKFLTGMYEAVSNKNINPKANKSADTLANDVPIPVGISPSIFTVH
ncbi:hypothetical protein RHGRI_009966 [Rhododendron griersonianum]|uniref:Uncharacterized protein n=1 Tax=Rhododendron griersonianum TaxID=479676 RepID=A0AAV6KGU8_9ERIC|nr:hypothetical protein RHGRI_009966 [Rhododendron griersonianum]